MKILLANALVFLAASLGGIAFVQNAVQPTNDLPNPFRAIPNWGTLPDGRPWGSTSAVDIDPDGKSIWVGERCGKRQHAPCRGSNLDPILKFDQNGKLLKSFGANLLIFPHSLHVDKEGNVWVSDTQDDTIEPEIRGAWAPRPPGPPDAVGPPKGTTRGHQVFKFSPDGRLLMTLGKPGGAAAPDYFFQPNDVQTAANGDVFVSEGHGQGNARILKFNREGKLIQTWGKKGKAPGEFDAPHTLAMDSRGRLYVGDRGNNRIQIFEQDGTFVAQWSQFSRPSGIFIDRNDILYVADSESGTTTDRHPGWKRGIRFGSVKDGKVTTLIPDEETKPNGSSGPEGVAADAQGNVFGAEVGQQDIRKYVKK